MLGKGATAYGLRILAAEDNAVNQKVIAAMLRQAGYHVDTACNGADAVAAHRSNPYNLILMDLHMPEMDGWEATWHIRSSKQPQPQIVAVSANVMGTVREKCQDAGLDDYLPKPFTSDQLLAVIARARDRQSSSALITSS